MMTKRFYLYLIVFFVSTNLLANEMSDTEAGFSGESCTSCSRENNLLPHLPPISKKNIKTCNLISYKQKLMEGTLSDHWAQELIGSDLLREELKNTPPPERENWILVSDSQQGRHNLGSKNVISDEGSHAVLPELGNKKVVFIQVAMGKSYNKISELFADYQDKDPNHTKKAPHFINNSMEWGRHEKNIPEKLQELSPPAIVITASGNKFPNRLSHLKTQASKNFDAIIVGSFSPSGFVSDFSISGEEVHILAPSDRWLTSAGEKGEYKEFGGTSGAAPLVTASLAGFEWLSGYHPTAKEAKTLLEKTALPNLNYHEKPQVNGVGLVNAYKLGEVGKRLKNKCKKNISCFKNEILKQENYYFDLDQLDKNLKRDLNKTFPSCAIGEKTITFIEKASCEEKEKVFKRLRKAFLLNPKDSKKFLKSLSCIYKEGGFSQNAEALNKIALAIGPEKEVRSSVRVLAKEKEPISEEVIRLMVGMGGFEEEFKLFQNKNAIKMARGIGVSALPLLNKTLETGDSATQLVAVEAAGIIGEPGLPIVNQAFKNNDPELRKTAVKAAGRIGKPGLPIVNQAFKNNDPELRKTAVKAAGRIGKPGLPIVNQAFKNNDDPELILTAVEAAGIIGEPGLPIINQAFKNNDPKLKRVIIEIASGMGEPGLPIVDQAFKSNDPELMLTAVEAAGRIGEPAIPFFKEILENKKLDPTIREEINLRIKWLKQTYIWEEQK